MRKLLAVLILVTAIVAAAPQEHFARLNIGNGSHLRVRYLVEGKGAVTLVLIHGWTCSAAFWRQQSTDLSQHYKVISIDLPGHGKSDKPQNIEYTVPLFAAGVEAVMHDAHVGKAVIAGHSMGVPVAMQTIVDYPDRFLGFVAVDGAIWKYSGPRTKPSQFAQRLRNDYAGTASVNLEAMFSASTPADLREEIRERMLATPGYVAASASENLGDSDVWTHAPALIPTLVIVGGRQNNDDRRAMYTEFFPNSQFEVWEEAGHFLMMEQPGRFNRLVIDFITKLTGTR